MAGGEPVRTPAEVTASEVLLRTCVWFREPGANSGIGGFLWCEGDGQEFIEQCTEAGVKAWAIDVETRRA